MRKTSNRSGGRAATLLVLGCALIASVSLAQSQSAHKAPQLPPDARTTPEKDAQIPQIKKPQTCEDQCDMLVDPCKKPCESTKVKKQAKGACKEQCDKIERACLGSCREKGRIDPQYMQEHLPKPKGAPAH